MAVCLIGLPNTRMIHYLNHEEFPTVSICTPTFNRRPFIPALIECVVNQTYPANRLEWIIVDDGTDPVGDLFANVPIARYVRYPEKMTLGKKRNITNDLCAGNIIIYMDDDDYYPEERVEHAVEKLTGPTTDGLGFFTSLLTSLVNNGKVSA